MAALVTPSLAVAAAESTPTFTVKLDSVLMKLKVVEAVLPVWAAVICCSVESLDFWSAWLMVVRACVIVVSAAVRFTVRLC